MSADFSSTTVVKTTYPDSGMSSSFRISTAISMQATPPFMSTVPRPCRKLKFEIKEGPLAHIEIVDIRVLPLGNSMFAVSWQERDGATVTNVQDYDRGLIHSHATWANGRRPPPARRGVGWQRHSALGSIFERSCMPVA